MIPASHLLAGVVAGRIARQCWQQSGPHPRPWQDPFLAASVAASVFPDWDILPGLAAGYDGVEFHRDATHSPVGVLLQALLMTPLGAALWRWLGARFSGLGLAPAPPAGPLFLTLLAGMGMHALTDALNPWGVTPWWPVNRDGASWNLVHEGDLVFLALTAMCAALALFARARTILLATGLVFLGFVAWKAAGRGEAEELAARALGPQAVVYPTPAMDCPWAALARAGEEAQGACVRPGGDEPLRIVRTVRSPESPLVEASKAHPDVADFVEKHPFPFAELERGADGRTLVLWRDLREALLEDPEDPRFGLAVSFDDQGRVVSVEHRWLLKVWF